MYLKSLTLKGFKSFASGTTLRFEPGVTCVVGPNGSGKSNVVDAIAWVLGEQGAKSLRGGKMEDVIFAGTKSRPPLGRAEVVLTIDNSDGALPIEYAEVTISRLMYRSGESEYAINGHRCRLLDVQELLSDSGIGREMHVIVGQGQLDAVLHAAPEDRRAYIEEAAGILKHRRRKEKALRKLAATDQNTARLTDLLTEIRRQLRPLGRQAEAARRAATVQADLRDAKARLLADDVVRARGELARCRDTEQTDRAHHERAREQLDGAREALGALEADLASATADEVSHRELAHRLERLLVRFRGVADLAAERRANLEQPLPARDSADPEALDRTAATLRVELDGLAGNVAEAQERLATAGTVRSAAEAAAGEAERAYLAAVRAAADRREGLARLSEQVRSAESRASTSAAEVGRLEAARSDVVARIGQAGEQLERMRLEAGGFDDAEAELDRRHEEAARRHEEALNRLAAVVSAVAELRSASATAGARAEALALGLRRKDGVGALTEDPAPEAAPDGAPEATPDGAGRPRVLGAVGALVSVTPGYEAALAAALGPAAEAVAVPGLDGARDTVAWLNGTDLGRAGMLVVHENPGHREVPLPAGARVVLQPGTVRLADLVVGSDAVAATIRLLLSDVVVVDDIDAAIAVVRAQPELRAVTVSGDLVGALWASGGPTGAPSVIEVRAAYEAACADRDRAGSELAAALLEEERCRVAAAAAEEERGVALTELNASDARIAAAEDALARQSGLVRAAEAELQRIEKGLATATRAGDEAQHMLAGLRDRLTALESDRVTAEEPDDRAKNQAASAATAARADETEARLALRAGEERHRTLAERLRRVERAAAAEREARRQQAESRDRRARGAAAGREVEDVARAAQDLVGRRLAEVVGRRDTASAAVADLRGRLAEARRSVAGATADLERLAAALHREDVARTERQVRLDDLERRATEELRMSVEDLVADFGPDRPVPTGGEDGDSRPFDRGEQEQRLVKAEKDLARIGSVNPLALEEFAALEERHDFLARQLEDVKATRRDLMTVVAEVDERIRTVFAQAFEEVAAQFTEVFAALFPGGEGRLVLTEPDDPLRTGVEVEARPPGKKVKRLSLLSGGERSLTAIALLVAIFRARPSPFYILDEVEAALDDTNLTRLVGLLDSLRLSSQLVIITHQKRTMEVADALYGVSMQGDGVSKVISQRLRERDALPQARTAPQDELV